MISGTYKLLQQQIADELGDRQDLLQPLGDSGLSTSPIQNAIQSSISFWERQRFYFNEFLLETPLVGPYPFQTVIGQEYYAAADYVNIPLLAKIDKIWLLAFSQRYTLNARTAQYLEDVSVNQASKSLPTDWAYQAQKLRLYPIPDNAYPVGMLGTLKQAALANDGDTNAWTTDAFDLIRSDAKRILAREILYDEQIETAMNRAIHGDPANPEDKGYLFALRAETSRRTGQGRVRPTHF